MFTEMKPMHNSSAAKRIPHPRKEGAVPGDGLQKMRWRGFVQRILKETAKRNNKQRKERPDSVECPTRGGGHCRMPAVRRMAHVDD